MERLVLALGSAFALAGCMTNQAGPPPPNVIAPDPNDPRFAPAYLANAASSDQFEIQSGQLALQMSQNAQVRNFGNMLVAHHTQSTQQVTAAAQSAGIMIPPPVLLPQHQQMLDQLRAAGPNFDLAFRDMQINAHQQALTLHQSYAQGGDVPALRNAAAGIVPVVQQHLAMAQSLQVALPPPPMAPQSYPQRSPGERG